MKFEASGVNVKGGHFKERLMILCPQDVSPAVIGRLVPWPLIG